MRLGAVLQIVARVVRREGGAADGARVFVEAVLKDGEGSGGGAVYAEMDGVCLPVRSFLVARSTTNL